MPGMTTGIRITYDGKPALTANQAADRYGWEPTTMRVAIKRLVDAGKLSPTPEGIDARTPLYLVADLEKALARRPGKGNWATD